MEINEEMKKRIVVYTVIVGDYDYLKTPQYIMDNCDYICFTDNKNLKSDIWQIRYLEDTKLDGTRWNRKYKILPHKYLKEYEWSIYVDGNVRLIGDMREYILNESKGNPMLCLRHSSRNSLFEEAEECIKYKKDNENIIRRQIEQYRSEGYKGDNGLTVNNILVRKHNDLNVIKVMEDWWHEIETQSCRDQLSFRYVCWKNDFECDISDLKCWKSPYWLNPGIHTSNIEKVEEELIEHLSLEDYYEYKIKEQEKYIALKEQELKDANTQLSWKEQELKDANTQLSWKEQELKDANTQLNWKEQELKDANTQLNWKEQELKDANTQLGWKEQELDLIKNSKRWKVLSKVHSVCSLTKNTDK